jgi:hypothetical protein
MMQALVLARIFLRVAFAGALMDVYRRGAVESPPVTVAA